MALETFDIEFRARLDDFKRELDTIPGITKKAARELTREWTRGMKQAQKDATKTAAQAAKAWDQGMSKIATSLESVVPGLAQARVAMGQFQAATAGGSVAAAKFIATMAPLAAGAAVVAGIVALNHSAEQLRGEMLALNQTTGLLPETLAALEVAGGRDLLGRLREGLGEFQVRVAEAARGTGEFKRSAEALGLELRNQDGTLKSTNELFTEFVAKVQEVESPTERAALMTKAFGGAGRELAAALGSTSLDKWVRITEGYAVTVGPEAADATNRWNNATSQLGISLRVAATTFETSFGLKSKAADAIDFVSLSIDMMSARLGVMRAEGIMSATLFEDMQKAAEDAQIKFFELRAARLEAAGETSGGGAGLPSGAAARGASERAKQAREVSEAEQKILDIMRAQSAEMAGGINKQLQIQDEAIHNLVLAYERLGDVAADAARKTNANVEALGSDALQVMNQKAQQIGATAGVAMQAIGSLVSSVFEHQIRAAEDGSDKQKRLMRQQFAAQKAFAIAQATLNATLATISVFAQTPGEIIARTIAAGIAGAIGAAQVAAVAATPGPKLHTGGMVSRIGEAPEVPRVLLPGEAVLNRQAVQDVGGPSGVNRMNTRQGGTGGGMVVVTMLSGRVLDAVVESDLSRPGSALGSAVRAGRMAGRRRTALGV